MADVDVVLISPAREGGAGDRVSVSESRARSLIAGGVAHAATKPEAKKLGVPEDSAATAKK